MTKDPAMPVEIAPPKLSREEPMNDSKMEPCPLCGSEDVAGDCYDRNKEGVCVEPAVNCNGCGTIFILAFEEADPYEEITRRWNTRAALEASGGVEDALPIETAPKTPADLSETLDFLAWCPDETAPKGGDWRIVWWEPHHNEGKGQWWGDRDLPEKPTLWKPLPGTPREHQG